MKYLIAYYLSRPADYDVEDIPNAIRSIDRNATNCFESVWLVRSTANTSEIKQRIAQLLEPKDKLIVSMAGDTEFSGFDSVQTAWLMDEIDE